MGICLVRYSKKLKKKIIDNWVREEGDALISSRVVNDISLRVEISSTCLIECDSMAEYAYCILNDIIKHPKCKCCENNTKFKRFKLGYAEYCSVKCRANDPDWQKQTAKTNTEKYGVTHIAKLKHERVKRSEQLLKNRETVNYNSPEIKQKRKQTIYERYGDVNTGWNEKAIESRIRNGTMVPRDQIEPYRRYKNKVSNLTNKQDLSFLDDIEKRGVYTSENKDVYHVDHIVSISEGFLNDVPPEVISSPPNLRCIKACDNMAKNNKSDMTIDELYKEYDKWKKCSTS